MATDTCMGRTYYGIELTPWGTRRISLLTPLGQWKNFMIPEGWGTDLPSLPCDIKVTYLPKKKHPVISTLMIVPSKPVSCQL